MFTVSVGPGCILICGFVINKRGNAFWILCKADAFDSLGFHHHHNHNHNDLLVQLSEYLIFIYGSTCKKKMMKLLNRHNFKILPVFSIKNKNSFH